jgi:endonuclease III
MRGATECARRLKTLFSSLRAKLGKLSPPAAADPITHLILGILSRNAPESKAREALDRIRSVVVDYNELRVIPAIELAEMLGEYPDVRLKCEDISRALNKVFALRHAVTLDDVVDMPRKEGRALLEQLDGLEPYSRARIRLLGLQQHAIPLDEAMWAYACREGIVDARCSLEEAQAFLERRISEEEALEFVALLNRQAWSEMGAAVRRGECARITSVPPDRTARNMLQAVGALAEQQRASDAAAETAGQRRAAAAAAPTARRQRVSARVVKVRQPKPAAGSPDDNTPPADQAKARSSSRKRQPTTKAARRSRKSPPSPSAAQPEAKPKSGAKGARRRTVKGKSAPRAASAKRVAKRKASAE